MGQTVKTVKDQYLCFGPALLPSAWPTALRNGFEGLTAVADWYKPTGQEIYTRNNVICSLDFWNRQCKTNITVNQSTEVTDVSDDCNDDQQIVTKNVRSINFTANDYKGVIADDGATLPIPPASVRALEQAYKSKGCMLVPVLWTDSPKDEDGARGVLLLALVSEFNFPGGGINDASSLTVTLVPGPTPLRNHDEMPMKNALCVSCFSDTAFADLPDDFYIGELVEVGSDLAGYTAPAVTAGGSAVIAPDPTARTSALARSNRRTRKEN